MYINDLNDRQKFIENEKRIREFLASKRSGSWVLDQMMLSALTDDVVKSSEIEGMMLDEAAVRLSVARHLGIKGRAPGPNYSLNERQKKLIILLLGCFEGNLSTSKWAKIAKCSQDTAYRDILNLVEQGILTKGPKKGRSTSYFLAK